VIHNSVGARQTVSPGTRLNGLFDIEALVASGPTGEVYRARRVQSDDVVAIKLLLPEMAGNEATLALCRKEVAALSKLRHEAVARYFVFSMEPTLRRPYVAMEYVDGHSLSDLIKRGALTFEAVRTLMKRVAVGLQAAHKSGIVHRDLSPDAIMIPTGGDIGRAKLIGFGVARTTKPGGDGTVIGGLAPRSTYLSPEHFGLFGGEITAKSDIYSFGLVLFEALAGKPLDMGGTPYQVLEKRRKVPDLGAVEMRFRTLIDRMLQPSPADRPESMDEVAKWPLGAQKIMRRRNLDDVYGKPKDADEETSPAGRRVSKKWAFGGAAAALLLGGGAAGYYFLAPVAPTTPPGASVTARLTPGGQPPQVSPPPEGSLTPPPSAAQSSLSPTAPAAAPAAPAPAGPTLPPVPDAPRPAPVVEPPPVVQTAPPVLFPEQAPGPASQEFVVRPSQSRPSGNAPAGGRPGAQPPAAAPRPSGAATGARPAVDAATSPSPTGPSAGRPSRIEQITRYVTDYPGGNCFFAAPVTITAGSAKIEGYGVSADPFQALDDDFKRANGFEADIGLRQITPQQCAALTFLNRARSSGSTPRLQISDTNVTPGQSLTGSVDAGRGPVHLLLVSDTGSVQNITSMLKPGPDGKAFNLKMQRTVGSGARPQLLIAIASAKPLESLRPGANGPAEQVFPQLLAEAERSGTVAAEVKYFKLER
jgi:eukaryotic-like serine/threonine-protein kinase